MSAASAPPHTVPEQRANQPGHRAAAEDRGRTVIPERVVARIAARAVSEAEPSAGGSGRRGRRLGVLLEGTAGAVRAQAKVNGGLAVVRIKLAVRYPSPIGQAAREIREHVRERIEGLTGLRVQHVDIEVAELVRDTRG